MSLARMLDREVTLIPRRVVGVVRGRETIEDGDPISGIRALRNLKTGTEDEDRRDQQVRIYRYLIQARHPETGEILEISGHDRILDAGETFGIVGPVDVAEARLRRAVHHFEFDAERFGSAPSEVGS